MERTVNERLSIFVDKIYNGVSQRLAGAIGMGQTTVNNYMNGSRKPSLEFICAILDTHLYLSAEWLLRGKGEMFTNELPTTNQVNVNGNKNIVGNSASYIVSNPDDEITEADFEIVEKIPIVPAQLVKVPNLDVYEELAKRPQELKMVLRGSAYADLVARIKDMAMYPEFQPNDEVYLKVIDNWEHLVNGAVYVVDTYSKGMLCRMLYDEGEYYTAKSRQDRYSEFKIPKDDIIRVFNITQLRRIPN